MSGGFGGDGWADVPWGGSEVDIVGQLIDVLALDAVSVTDSPTVTVFRASIDTLGIDDSVGYDTPLRVEGAFAPTPLNVTVIFSNRLDLSYAPLSQASNYTIPGLTVTAAAPITDTEVLLTTTPAQQDILYTVTVAQAVSFNGDALGSDNSAEFLGFVSALTFLVGAQSTTQVQVVFSAAMQTDPNFFTPTNYTIHEAEGSDPVTVLSVAASGDEPLRRATLQLGTALKSKEYYALTVSPLVKSVIGRSADPDTFIFQWGDMTGAAHGRPLEIPIKDFTGEVSGGILGTPDGQVFFSPALLQAVTATSTLEVEEVSVCSLAFDQYTFPVVPDPIPLYTFSKGVPSVIGPTSVLWAPAARLGQAQFTLSPSFADFLDLAVFDGPASGVLAETIDITSGGFLNDRRWVMGGSYSSSSVSGKNITASDTLSVIESLTVERLAPGFTATRTNPAPSIFRIANNLSPIGPGPTVPVKLGDPEIKLIDFLSITDGASANTGGCQSPFDTTFDYTFRCAGVNVFDDTFDSTFG